MTLLSFIFIAPSGRKEDSEVVSPDESPDHAGQEKDEQGKIPLFGIDERFTGLSPGLFRKFLDHRLVDAGPGGGSAGQACRSGEEKPRDRQNQ
jgi:hypothetical protein